jgi:hypothetical protein
MQATPPTEAGASGRWKRILARFGLAGFLFFFIKGLVWIAVFALGWKGCQTLREPEGAGMGANNPEVAPHEILPFQRLDHAVFVGFVLEIDKSKSFGSAALPVANDGNVLDRSGGLYQIPEFFIPGLVGEVPNVNRHKYCLLPI